MGGATTSLRARGNSDVEASDPCECKICAPVIHRLGAVSRCMPARPSSLLRLHPHNLMGPASSLCTRWPARHNRDEGASSRGTAFIYPPSAHKKKPARRRATGRLDCGGLKKRSQADRAERRVVMTTPNPISRHSASMPPGSPAQVHCAVQTSFVVQGSPSSQGPPSLVGVGSQPPVFGLQTEEQHSPGGPQSTVSTTLHPPVSRSSRWCTRCRHHTAPVR
jgi:hypothetical protein